MTVASGRCCYGHCRKCEVHVILRSRPADNAGSTSNILSDADRAAMQLRTVTHDSHNVLMGEAKIAIPKGKKIAKYNRKGFLHAKHYRIMVPILPPILDVTALANRTMMPPPSHLHHIPSSLIPPSPPPLLPLPNIPHAKHMLTCTHAHTPSNKTRIQPIYTCPTFPKAMTRRLVHLTPASIPGTLHVKVSLVCMHNIHLSYLWVCLSRFGLRNSPTHSSDSGWRLE